MNEEEVRQLAKNILSEQMSEEIKKHLDSAIIFKYTNDIEQELQAYKDKEDKLKELLKNNKLENIKCDCNCLRNFVGNIEQILNEGE